MKLATFNIFEWALSNGMRVMMEAVYLIPEYERLRNYPLAMQWKNHRGSDNEFMVSFTIGRISFKNIVA